MWFREKLNITIHVINMEALAAVGLASNILQFIDFGITLVSEAREIHHSVSGTTKEFDNLRELCEYLSRLSLGLIAPTSEDSKRQQFRIQAEDDLAALALKCHSIATQLCQDLSNLSIGESSFPSKFSSIRQALKNTIGKDGVKDLSKRLASCREVLMLCLAAITKSVEFCNIQSSASGR